jgi:2-dehydro-3-deoxygluconokinase
MGDPAALAPRRPPEVVTLGECLMALVATEYGPLAEARSFSAHVAGAEANVVVGLARLGHTTAFIGRVGSDGFGTAIRRSLRGAGVGVDWLRVDPAAPTGILVRERRALGPAEVVYYRSGSAGSRLDASDVDSASGEGAFRAARWLHVTGITPALSASARAALDRALEHAREAGLTISLDVNLRRKLWTDAEARPVLAPIAGQADVVLASDDEAAGITQAAADSLPERLLDALLDLGPSLAVLKLGSGGALAREQAGEVVRRPAVAVTVVDPIGAGDAFSAGFIASRLEGADLVHALEVANLCGAAAIAAVGDQAGLLDRAELDRLPASPIADTIR